MMQPGLYIVGTPIGNLGDLSPRAVETLKSADLIACEDTRVAGKLASAFDIKTPRIAMHEHNERELIGKITDMISGRATSRGAPQLALNPGAAVAIITDSGMPAISDPGFRLIRACRDSGLPVFIVPGPTALISALVLSGFPTDRFTFCGFLPASDAARDAAIHTDNKIRHTIIYYESPNRVMDTIAALARIMPERRVAIVREITKIHEETVIDYPAEILNGGATLSQGRLLAGGFGTNPPHQDKPALPIPFKGEIVLVIEPAPEQKISDDQINEIVREVVRGAASTKAKAAEIADRTGMSKSEAYERVIKK